jgi:hypothetical protein
MWCQGCSGGIKVKYFQCNHSYGDKSSSKVLGFGKVVVTLDVSLVNVMLVKTIGYNLLSVFQLSTTGFATYDIAFVVVM